MGTNDRAICKFVTQWKVYHQQRGFCDLKRTQQGGRLEAFSGRNQQHQIYLVFYPAITVQVTKCKTVEEAEEETLKNTKK